MSRRPCDSVRELRAELRGIDPHDRSLSLAAIVAHGAGGDSDCVENLLQEISHLAQGVERSLTEEDLDTKTAAGKHNTFIWAAVDAIIRKVETIHSLRDAEREERQDAGVLQAAAE